MDVQKANGKLNELRTVLARAKANFDASCRQTLTPLRMLREHEDAGVREEAAQLAADYSLDLADG